MIPITRSPRPLARVPVALEVVDQRGTVEAVGLLAGIAAHVAPEEVERLLTLAQRLAVGDEARRAGADDLRGGRLDRLVHPISRQHGVGELKAPGAVCRERAVEEERLARRALADEPRQAQVGAAG